MAHFYFLLIFLFVCNLPAQSNPLEEKELSKELSLENSTLLQRWEFLRASAMASPLTRAGYSEAPTRMLYSTGIDFPGFNGVVEKDGRQTIAENDIKRVMEFFEDKHISFIWWTSEKILENYGFVYGGAFTGMCLDLSKMPLIEVFCPASLKIQAIESEEDFYLFARLSITNSLGESEKISNQFFRLNQSLSELREQVQFIAYWEDVPVGTVTLSTNTSSAGIWGLTTSSSHRKRGIGRALIDTAITEAQKRGYQRVAAFLEPKGMAWNLFIQSGFKETGSFPFYVYVNNL